MGFWGWFYALAVVGTLLHAHIPIIPLKGRQHAAGSEVIAISWVAAYLARDVFDDPTPLAAYGIIDVSTAGAFLWLAHRRRAIWAALCVILHAAMATLHLAYFVSGEGNDNGYIWVLNTMFLLALIDINIAIMAGRYEWGENIDRLVHFARGWNFSGVRRQRGANYKETA